jgi:hypothetical protein
MVQNRKKKMEQKRGDDLVIFSRTFYFILQVVEHFINACGT